MLEMIWNHLWQSTLFAGAVAILALAFRNNRAHVRYWLWLAASVKFLIPFGALLWIGSGIELVPIERSGQEIIGVLDNAAEPFTETLEPRGERRLVGGVGVETGAAQRWPARRGGAGTRARSR